MFEPVTPQTIFLSCILIRSRTNSLKQTFFDTMNYKSLIPKYRINLTVFRKGSIVAEFKLIFHVNVEPKDAYGMLKREINDGNLGTLRVDPSSLKQIPPPTKGDFTIP